MPWAGVTAFYILPAAHCRGAACRFLPTLCPDPHLPPWPSLKAAQGRGPHRWATQTAGSGAINGAPRGESRLDGILG